MTPPANELIADPLFQLNAVLWMAQPLPEGYPITPLLHRSGFDVYALAPRLVVPLELRLTADQNELPLHQSVSPDVVLNRETEGKFAFIECKRSSFSPQSDTSHQARALLIVAGPRAGEALGLTESLTMDTLLTYLTSEDQRNLLAPTLRSLASDLGGVGIPTAASAILGMERQATAIDIVMDTAASQFFGLPSGHQALISLVDEPNPRLLYLIPYDPDVTQTPQEIALCKRSLFERIQSSVIAATGKAIPPTELIMHSESLLNDAMFGMFAKWENPDSRRHMRQLCRYLMERLVSAVNSAIPNTMAGESGGVWKITLRDGNHHEDTVDALTRFSCETLDLKQELPPALFDIDQRGP